MGITLIVTSSLEAGFNKTINTSVPEIVALVAATIFHCELKLYKP